MTLPSPSEQTEHTLTGGDIAPNVVRIGATVRKPVTPATPLVESFLHHLEQSGFQHAPRSLGRDSQNRQILDFIPGSTITQPESLTLDDLSQIAAIIKTLHQLSAALPRTGSEILCHNDLGPWNLVRSGNRWVFIDWDGIAPSLPLADLAYAAQSIVHLAPGGNPHHDAQRLRTFIDAYGLNPTERAAFPQILLERTRFNHDFLRHHAEQHTEPWATLYADGQGDYWLKAAAYIAQHQPLWLQALT